MVLILVLVEDGLRGMLAYSMIKGIRCLNPCSCGGWSQRRYARDNETLCGLNPCSCGGWSQRRI